MTWEIFRGGKLQLDGPAASILSSGKIHMNKEGVDSLFIEGDFKFVQLLFDQEERKVGIRICEEETPDSFSVFFPRGGGNGATISCVGFLNFIGYDWNESRNFSAEYEEFEDSAGLAITIPEHLLGHGPISRAKRIAAKKLKEKEVPEGTS